MRTFLFFAFYGTIDTQRQLCVSQHFTEKNSQNRQELIKRIKDGDDGMERRKTKRICAGNLSIGGGAEISVQSMLNVPAEDVEGNVKQAVSLEQAGCQMVRVAIPNQEAVRLIPAIKREVAIPLVADIHLDYRLALESIEAGIDKIRINPGNIGDKDQIKAVVNACRLHKIPIRIGGEFWLLGERIVGEIWPSYSTGFV